MKDIVMRDFGGFPGDGARIVGVPVGRGTTFEERMSYDPVAACGCNELDYRYEAEGEISPEEEPVGTLD